MKIKSYIYIIIVTLSLFVVVTVRTWLPVTTDDNSFNLHHYYQLCSPGQSCLLENGSIRVSLTISPSSLPVLEPLQLDVILEGFNAKHVSVEFTGRNMPMGLMPVILKKKGNWWSDHYSGVGSITFCASDRDMVWIAKVLIQTATDLHAVDFELQ